MSVVVTRNTKTTQKTGEAGWGDGGKDWEGGGRGGARGEGGGGTHTHTHMQTTIHNYSHVSYISMRGDGGIIVL